MYPVAPRFLAAIRNPPTIITRVEVWLGGVRVDTYGDAGIPIYGGQVDVDPSKQVRRALTNIKVDATDEMWNLLSPVGTELRAYRGFRYLNGETDMVPLGRFVVPNLSQTYGGDWSGRVGSAPDRMFKVQQARFTSPRSFPVGMSIRTIIATLVGEVLGDVTNLASSMALTASPMLFDRDRGKAIGELAASIGADVFCAPDGTPTIRDIPQLANVGVWSIDTGDAGILYTAERERNYERTYSGVTVNPSQVDGAAPFDPVTVWDEDPLSPTYHLGPFGKVPFFYSSSLLANGAQARSAAFSLLPRVTAIRAQLSIEAECNPALADGDTITVVLPPRQRGGTSVTERHLVGPFTVPATPDGLQHIDTLSAVADVEES